jgi:hypothetical protein
MEGLPETGQQVIFFEVWRLEAQVRHDASPFFCGSAFSRPSDSSSNPPQTTLGLSLVYVCKPRRIGGLPTEPFLAMGIGSARHRTNMA